MKPELRECRPPCLRGCAGLGVTQFMPPGHQSPAADERARQDGQVSVLEFIASIKWPVTVLLLVALGTVVLRGSPGTRRSMGEWISQRNLRLNLGGQEIEATLAETQGRMGLAAETDSQLAGENAADGTANDQQGSDSVTPVSVEVARRAAVEDLMRIATLLGWQLARSGASAPPDTTVRWGEDGRPVIESQTVAHESGASVGGMGVRRWPAPSKAGGQISETVFNREAHITYNIHAAGTELVEDVLNRLPAEVRQPSEDDSRSGYHDHNGTP